jgi:hypothetical protein
MRPVIVAVEEVAATTVSAKLRPWKRTSPLDAASTYAVVVWCG